MPAETMLAIVLDGEGGPEVLRRAEVARPEAARGELRLRIGYAGVNRPDLIQRAGFYPAPAGHSPILGLEAAGWVDGVGEDVSGFKPGDRVMALLNGGGYAEYVTVPAGQVLKLPRGLSLAEAAGLPETAFTVIANVFEAGQLRPDETLLVHGAASGIGTLAIQLARYNGAKVLATARTASKHEALRALGAELVLDPAAGDWVEDVRRIGGADVVLDMIGGDSVNANLRALNPGGRLVFIAFLTGSKVKADLMSVMLKRLTITGSTLRARPDNEKARLAREVKKRVFPAIRDGALKPVIDRVFPLAEAADAHRWLDSSQHVGKVILKVADDD